MSARAIWEAIRANGWSEVERWQRQAVTESLHSDFKVAVTTDPARGLAKDDLSSLARAVSGFANIDGGVLVFGVVCKSVKGSPDVVQAIRPVPNAAGFAEALRVNTLNAVEPVVGGLDVHTVLEPSGTGAGVIAMLIPRSNGGPHRATLGAEGVKHIYFLRTNDSTTVMPHRLLAALFAAPSEPDLVLFANWEQPHRIRIFLENRGPGVARNVRVIPRLEHRALNWTFNDTIQPATRWNRRHGEGVSIDRRDRLFALETIEVGHFEVGGDPGTGVVNVGGRIDSDTSRPRLLLSTRVMYGELRREICEPGHD